MKWTAVFLSWLAPPMAAAVAIEWKATLPSPTVPGARGPVFINAVQGGNGDYLVKGWSDREEYVLRLDPGGKQVWVHHTVHQADGVVVGLDPELHETANGPVALWELGNPLEVGYRNDLVAVRYDAQGLSAARVNLGMAESIAGRRHGVTRLGDAIFASSEYPNLYAGKRSLRGGPDWTVVFDQGRDLDLVGCFEAGHDRYLFVDNPVGGPEGDTLRLHMLDSSGHALWRSAIATGRKPAGSGGHRDASWTHFAALEGGRILMGGIDNAFNTEFEYGFDSLILAMAGSDGVPEWIRRFPVADQEHRMFWDIEKMEPDAAGNIRVRANGYLTIVELEISRFGSLLKSARKDIARFPPGILARPSRLDGGGLWAFGSSSDSLAHVPPLDTHKVASAIAYPTLYTLAATDQAEWKPLRFGAYGDTVFSYKYAIPGDESGAHIWETGGSGFHYLLPTSDGGALAGGYMLDRNVRDTLPVAAIKLAPGFAIGIFPGSGNIRAPSRLPRPGPLFDLLGRLRAGSKAPTGLYLPSPLRRP